MLWRIDTTDTGGESRAPREHIRNFAAGYDREFVRQVAGIPTGKTVTSAVWRCRRSANADSEIVFEKAVTPTFNLAEGQVADAGAGGIATLQFLLYGVETLELVRRAHIECIVTLSDGVQYPAMTRGTIKGYRSLVSVPAGIPSPAAILTGSKSADALADDATDVITFTVTDALGVALPGIVINVATADPTKVSISASTLVTNGSGQATVTIRKLVALGAGVTLPVTASIGSLQYPVAVSDSGGGGGGGGGGADTAVALVEWVEGNTGTVPNGGTLVRTARVKNAAGAVLAGKTVTFNNPDATKFTRAPASGVSDAGGLVAVTLTWVAAGGPVNLVATSDTIASANCAITAAAGSSFSLDAEFAGAAGAIGAADTGQALLATAGADWQRDGAGSLFLNDATGNGNFGGYIIDASGLSAGRYVEWQVTQFAVSGNNNAMRMAFGVSDAATAVFARGDTLRWYTLLAGTVGGAGISWKTNPDGVTAGDAPDVALVVGDVVRITNTAGVLAIAVNGVTKGYTAVSTFAAAIGGAGFGHGVGVIAHSFEGKVFNAGTPFVKWGYVKVSA